MREEKILIKKLLGYFTSEYPGGTCMIADRRYASYSLEHLSLFNNDNHQIIVPTRSVFGIKIKNYERLRAGVYVSFDIEDFYLSSNEVDRIEYSDEYIDIPVYALYDKNELLGISIEIDRWTTELKLIIDNVEQYNSQIKKNRYSVSTNRIPHRHKLLGYVTAIKSFILICEIDFMAICEQFDGYDPQIIIPAEDDNTPAFRAGVKFEIPPELLTPKELEDTEYPVFSEYKGNFLKKIFIDYTGKRKIEPVTTEEIKKVVFG